MELSSQCWIFSCWSINFKVVLFIVVIVISIYLKLHFHKFQSIANCWLRFCSDQTRIKSLLKRLKYIGMASEKLYRNTLSFLRKTFLWLQSHCYSYPQFPHSLLGTHGDHDPPPLWTKYEENKRPVDSEFICSTCRSCHCGLAVFMFFFQQ